MNDNRVTIGTFTAFFGNNLLLEQSTVRPRPALLLFPPLVSLMSCFHIENISSNIKSVGLCESVLAQHLPNQSIGEFLSGIPSTDRTTAAYVLSFILLVPVFPSITNHH